MRFYTLPPRGIDWPFLLVNSRNYRELFRRRFEHAIVDCGVEGFFNRQRAKCYPRWFLDWWKHLARYLTRVFSDRLWVTIPDVPSDYHPSDWADGSNIELTLRNVEEFITIDGVNWIVVVQSRYDDLLSYYSSLARTRELVGDHPRVAIGTVCKTRNLEFIVEACRATRAHFPKSHVHAFGLTLSALPMVARHIDSWDSLAYTFPRRRGRPSARTMSERIEYFRRYLDRVRRGCELVHSAQ